jgi:hypothetical protein
MPDDLAAYLGAARKHCEAATAGPWYNEPNTGAGRVWVQIGRKHFPDADCEPLFNVRNHGGSPTAQDYRQREADAAFIVAARKLMPALLGAVEAARKIIAEWEDEARRMDAQVDSPALAGSDNSLRRQVLGIRATGREECARALREAITSKLLTEESGTDGPQA